jgi:hypothetical protein
MADELPHALRLTFAWRGAQVSVVGSERVAMTVPASLAAPRERVTTGYSLALLDATGRVVYWRPLHSPIPIDAEAFSKAGTIERVPVTAGEGRFTLLVPDLPDAQQFRLSGPSDPRRPEDVATELLTVDVDALRKASGSPTPPASPRPGTRG